MGHVWLTGNETLEGFIGDRPHHYASRVLLNKPMVQLNESIGNGKNSVRNEILRFADQSGADAINFSNIADNTLKNQDVYAVFKDVNLNSKNRASKITDIIHGEKFNPKDLQNEINTGFNAASTFFNHPVVKQSYKHNQELAKRLGITIPDRPDNISDVVKSPVKIEYQPYVPENGGFELMSIAKETFNDPNTILNITNVPMTKELARAGALHEGLHRGYYSEAIKLPNMTKEQIMSEFLPSAKFWR